MHTAEFVIEKYLKTLVKQQYFYCGEYAHKQNSEGGVIQIKVDYEEGERQNCKA